MNSISIKVNIDPGISITDAAQEACEFSKRLGIRIDFKFNSVYCMVSPDSAPETLVENWGKATESAFANPIAVGWKR